MTELETQATKDSDPERGFYRLNTDGGIVADPRGQASGEAAIGVVLKAPLDQISKAIGPVEDHHVAEYQALIEGLKLARSRGIERLRVCLDSALVVNQLSGKSRVKAKHLKRLHTEALSLVKDFADIKITWVPRKANDEADALASRPLGPLRAHPATIPGEEPPLD